MTRLQGVKQLYDLQELDLRVSAADKSLAEVRASLADESALSSARDLVERLESQNEELAANRQAVQRTIDDLQQRLQKVESRLYGGAVTNPREFSAAEEEREFIQREQRNAEDQLLELMVETEDVQSAQASAQESLAQLEAERPVERAEMLKSEERLTGELAGLGQDRGLLVPQLPAQMLSLYDSLRRKGDGRAVAKVERGACQGCRLALSTMEFQRARSGQGIVQCGSCRRILYMV